MNYNDFFESALSAAYKKAPMTDDDTFMRIVKERAKNMKKNDNVKQMHFTEITPEYAEPKKSHKALNVFAGVAGTAAVLTGAVFGLNWLNEHGGLKEGGSNEIRAGYHGDATEPAQSEATVTEAVSEPKTKTEVPATFVYKTAAQTITVTGFEFDGKTLNLNWDVVFDLELEKYHNPEGSGAPLVNGMRSMDAFSFMGEPNENIKNVFISTNSIEDRTINHTMTVELENYADTVDLIFAPTVHDEFNVPEYTFTATVNAENVKPAVNENSGKTVYWFEGSTSFDIVFNFDDSTLSGDFEFLYYIDGELQNDLTETRSLSEMDKLHWEVSGTGVHTYKVDIVSLEKGSSGTLFEATVDFSKEEPEKDFHDSFNGKIFKQLVGQGDTPEFPIAISNGNGLYGEYLDTPLTGDEAWELVKERGGIEFDFPLPYDKNMFTYNGSEFCIEYADCDVTAFVGGTVEFADWCNGYGQSVLIHDENGHYWFWGHLGSVNVAEGDTIIAGDVIGHTGSTGYATNQRYAMRVG